MKKIHYIPYYVSVTGIFLLLIYWFVIQGQSLETHQIDKVVSSKYIDTFTHIRDNFDHSFKYPLAILLLQIIAIIIVARFFGYLFSKIGQPVVIGEIFAGIFLGPSLLGWIFPSFTEFLFPVESLKNLHFLSQFGLILFMFIVGMELDWKVLRGKAKDAILISHASIIFPFALGVGLALFLFKNYAPVNIKFLPFSLFIGLSLSITAFPVLARIVQERGISKTRIGSIAITCAAVDDVTAWCILASVIAIVNAGSFISAMATILIAFLYVVFMLLILKPFLNKLGTRYSSKETLSKPIVAIFFLVLLFSSYITEVVGIHALFGAFLAGVIMPENQKFRNIFIDKIGDISIVLLLPLFFVYTGLRTQIALLNTWDLWLTCGLIITAAITGKLLGSALSAKFVGYSWRESLVLGTLMNTRGLMELVVLNIGYDLGILKPEFFAMMVIMALFTTFITGPGLSLISYFKREKPKKEVQPKEGKVLLSFANPRMGSSLLKIGKAIVPDLLTDTEFVAIHISPRTDISPSDAAVFEKESFAHLLKTAGTLNVPIRTIYKNTGGDISLEIINICRTEKPDVLLVGTAYSIFSTDLLGGIIRKVLSEVRCDVLVFSERQRFQIDSMLIIFFGDDDEYLLNYAAVMKKETHQRCYVFPAGNANGNLSSLIKKSGFSPEIVKGRFTDPSFLENIDLILVSAENWKKVESTYPSLVKHFPSVLYVHQGSLPNRLLKLERV
jgi:Kef-type K+ transport system membrane component KefB/nucleotide-binding universal stress UspA family protein